VPALLAGKAFFVINRLACSWLVAVVYAAKMRHMRDIRRCRRFGTLN
jgi:hypothetical protein